MSGAVPAHCGRLPVGDGHELHWEVHGPAAGSPCVVLHGGPGSGAAAWWTELFDLTRHRVVLFDQRGCGRSTPDAGRDPAALAANTTHHLVADIERLREHLGVERWLVVGASWGTTLALAYAQRHVARVTALVLFAVATTTRADVTWATRGVGRYFPAEWRRFRDGVPAAERDGDLATAYARLLADPDPAVAADAAARWCAWEVDAHEPPGRSAGPALRRPPSSGCGSRGWSRTTGGTRPGSARASCSRASRPRGDARRCSSTAGSTSARRSRPPGAWPSAGRRPSSS